MTQTLLGIETTQIPTAGWESAMEKYTEDNERWLRWLVSNPHRSNDRNLGQGLLSSTISGPGASQLT